MTAGFSIALAAVSVLILLARFALRQLPLAGRAVRIAVGDALLLGVGVLGLAFHCTAMFYRQLFDVIVVLQPLVALVNAMGVASIVLFVVPALLLLLGLRHQHWAALVALTLTLIFVGITMYLVGPLQVHLAAIFVSVVALVGVVALLVLPPWRRQTVTTERSLSGR